MTTKAQHLTEAKRAVAAGDKSYRLAADHMAAAQKQGATQREIADKVGKSPAWVNDLLRWRTYGFKDTPFTSKNAMAKARRCSLSEQAEPSAGDDDAEAEWLSSRAGQRTEKVKAKFNGKDIDLEALGPAAREQLAKKLNDQEEPPRPGPTTSLEVERLKAEVEALKKSIEEQRIGLR
jgi:hypothetical protein